MARTNATNFTGALQFPMADAATDLFKKEDVQTLAKAVDGHDHTSGKGLVLPASAIPPITSAMILNSTIVDEDIAGVGGNKVNWAAAIEGSIPGSKIQSASITSTQLQDGAASAYLNHYKANVTWSTTTVNTWLVTPIAIAVTTTGPRIRLEGSVSYYHTANNAGIYLGFGLDGFTVESMAYLNIPTAGQTVNTTMVDYIAGVAGGAHTFSIMVHMSTAGTFTINAAALGSIFVNEQRR